MSTTLRQSSRKSTTGGDLKAEPRRSARLAAKTIKKAATEQPAVAAPVIVVAVSLPVVADNPSKKEIVVRTIQKYLNSVEQARNVEKVKVLCDMFEFIDKHFEFINTPEFHETKRFVLTVHDKTLELERDLVRQMENRASAQDNAYFWKNDYKFYNKAITLVKRVHTKCHLYGMDKFVLVDPIYKEFVDTFMVDFL